MVRHTYSAVSSSWLLSIDMGILEGIQQGSAKVMKGLEERQRELVLFSLEKRTLRGDLINVYKYLMGEVQKMRLGSFQCPVTGQEATGTS